MATTHIPVPTLGRPPRGALKHAGAVAAILVLALLLGAGLLVWQAARGGEATTPDEPPVAAPTASPELTAGRQAAAAPTYYVVGSQVLADALRTAIGEADTLRAHRGEAVVESSVLLVGSAEEGVVLPRLAEQDAIRAELGLPPIHFVDLRVLLATTEPPGAAGLAGQEGLEPAPALAAATTPADTDERSQPAGETWDTP